MSFVREKPVEDGLRFEGRHLLEPVEDLTADVLASNPPYVTEAEYAALDPGVREFEPRRALVSGNAGMEHTRVLLEAAMGRLVPGGLLAIEVDSTRAEVVLDLAREIGWADARVEEDLFGRPRYLLATKEK